MTLCWQSITVRLYLGWRIKMSKTHGRDAEKSIEQLRKILSNLELFSKDVEELKLQLKLPTEKMFKINED